MLTLVRQVARLRPARPATQMLSGAQPLRLRPSKLATIALMRAQDWTLKAKYYNTSAPRGESRWKNDNGVQRERRSFDGQHSGGPYKRVPETLYSSDRVHVIPESPHLWTSGVVHREQFLILLNDLLSKTDFSAASKLWAQLVCQTHNEHASLTSETLKDILQDHMPRLPLPDLSEPEILGVFHALRRHGLVRQALALWHYYDKEQHHGTPLLKPHTHYYSNAFESGAYTISADVRNVQLLIDVLEVADETNNSALVCEIFERLAGGVVSDLKKGQVNRSEIPATPLWHVSYHRQLRVLELGLKNLDPHTQGDKIIDYMNTYRLKFATCWTPHFLLRLYSLLATLRTCSPATEDRANQIEALAKKLSYKIAAHHTLEAIRRDSCLSRIFAAQAPITIDQTELLAKASMTEAPTAPTPEEKPTSHPGLVNIIARVAEIQQAQPTEEDYQIIKQLYLECFELPYFFQDPHSILEPALKHFIKGNDVSAVHWLYQKSIESDITLSVNARNNMMFWALRTRNDPVQAIEVFNDMQVALGPQAANSATILLLFEAIEARGDLDAALNATSYIIDNMKSWTTLKQAFESTLNLILLKGTEQQLRSLSDSMSVYIPNAYSTRWRPRIVKHAQENGWTFTPPLPTQVGGAAFL